MSAERPEKTKIELVKSGGILTILIPRQGFRSLWGPMLLVGIMFLAIGSIPFFLNDVKIKKQMDWGVAHIAMLTFPSVGAIVILVSIFGALRRTAIVVADGALVITRTSLLMKVSKTWQKSELSWVMADLSNVKVNNRPLWQLQVLNARGRKSRYLTGRDEYELKWIAAELQQALGFTSASPAE